MPNTAADARLMADAGLKIAVGVLRDTRGRILIAQRRPGTPGAGQWEIPGGKHEPGETMRATLARELQEEVGVTPQVQYPLIRMTNGRARATQTVHLHVWLVEDWEGEAQSCEGQRLVWCPQNELLDYDLLPGNRAIINALRLPDRFAITPDIASQSRKAWFDSLRATLSRGITLLRLRAPSLADDAYAELAGEVIAQARGTGAQVLLDRTPDMVQQLGAAGLHWPAEQSAQAAQRPVSQDLWFAVSAHDRTGLQTAMRLGADFAVLSPVQTTASHPQRQPLGWHGWQALRAGHGLPVYALGGLCANAVDTAHAHNAQGVAAIRAFWGKAADRDQG